MVLTEAQKRANEKWHRNHRQRANYIAMRSSARSFIRKKSTLTDLDELEKLIQTRRNEISE